MDIISQQISQYYGSDWLAMIATFMYLYLIGNRKRVAFVYAFLRVSVG